MLKYCRVCKSETSHSIGRGLLNGLWVSADWPGDYSGPVTAATATRGQTLSRVGPAKLVPVVKCSSCGRSVTV